MVWIWQLWCFPGPIIFFAASLAAFSPWISDSEITLEAYGSLFPRASQSALCLRAQFWHSLYSGMEEKNGIGWKVILESSSPALCSVWATAAATPTGS